jgi:hypothetical protein
MAQVFFQAEVVSLLSGEREKYDKKCDKKLSTYF